MKKSLFFLILVVLAVSLVFAGCSSGTTPTPTPAPSNGDEDVQQLSQNEIIAEIDRITDAMNNGEISEEDGVEELKSVIEKPADYPKRNIEYVIAWGEGGGSDRYARSISREAEKIMGTRIIPNNMPGGGGEVALAYLMTQPADGYTIYGAITSQVIYQALGEQPYNFTEDTTFIIRNQGPTEVFWVRSDSEFETWEQMVEYAKENPGKVLITGSGSPSDCELRTAELNQQLGIDMVFVPSQGAGERVASLLGGHVHGLHESVGPVIDLYKTGQIRPILVPSETPFEGIDAPTTKEKGLTVSVGRWRGINAPKGLDAEIVRYLHNVFYAASKMPDYMTYEKESFLDISPGYLNSADYEASAKAEVGAITELMKSLGYID